MIYIFIGEDGTPKQSTVGPTPIDEALCQDGTLSILRVRSGRLVDSLAVEEHHNGKWLPATESKIKSEPGDKSKKYHD